MKQLESILSEVNQLRRSSDLFTSDYHKAVEAVKEMQEIENRHEKELAEINRNRPVVMQKPVEYKTRLIVRDYEGKPIVEYERPKRQPRPRREVQPLSGEQRVNMTLIKAATIAFVVLALCMLKSCGYSLW